MRPSRARRSGESILLTLQDAAAEYGPPYTSLRDLVLEGHLKHYQLGDSRRIWVKRADLEDLIEKGVRVGLNPSDRLGGDGGGGESET